MMRAALKVSEAYRPRWEGGDAVGLVGSVGIVESEQAPVCHYPIARFARARAHRTGFSRSGNRSRSSLRSVCFPNRRFVREDCRGLEARCRARFVLPYLVNGGAAPFTRPSSVSAGGGLFMQSPGGEGSWPEGSVSPLPAFRVPKAPGP